MSWRYNNKLTYRYFNKGCGLIRVRIYLLHASALREPTSTDKKLHFFRFRQVKHWPRLFIIFFIIFKSPTHLSAVSPSSSHKISRAHLKIFLSKVERSPNFIAYRQFVDQENQQPVHFNRWHHEINLSVCW